PLRRPPKGKDHPSASRTAFFGLPPDSRNPSSPQPSRLLDSPHHHADVGLADEKSGLAAAAGATGIVQQRETQVLSQNRPVPRTGPPALRETVRHVPTPLIPMVTASFVQFCMRPESRLPCTKPPNRAQPAQAPRTRHPARDRPPAPR